MPTVVAVPTLSLALKVPKIRRTGNTMQDQRAETSRQRLIDAINLLMAYRKLRPDAVAFHKRHAELELKDKLLVQCVVVLSPSTGVL